MKYLVDWEDSDQEERSWVPAKDILSPYLVEDFHTTQPEPLDGAVLSDL